MMKNNILIIFLKKDIKTLDREFCFNFELGTISCIAISQSCSFVSGSLILAHVELNRERLAVDFYTPEISDYLFRTTELNRERGREMRERGSNKWDDLVIDFRFYNSEHRRYRAIARDRFLRTSFFIFQERKSV